MLKDMSFNHFEECAIILASYSRRVLSLLPNRMQANKNEVILEDEFGVSKEDQVLTRSCDNK